MNLTRSALQRSYLFSSIDIAGICKSPFLLEAMNLETRRCFWNESPQRFVLAASKVTAGTASRTPQ
jgi:hypothetical protein